MGVILVAGAATVELPFMIQVDEEATVELAAEPSAGSQAPGATQGLGRSVIEEEEAKRAAHERALGDQRPGVTPPEAITGLPSSSGVGRAENPWSTKGKPIHGDELD